MPSSNSGQNGAGEASWRSVPQWERLSLVVPLFAIVVAVGYYALRVLARVPVVWSTFIPFTVPSMNAWFDIFSILTILPFLNALLVLARAKAIADFADNPPTSAAAIADAERRGDMLPRVTRDSSNPLFGTWPQEEKAERAALESSAVESKALAAGKATRSECGARAREEEDKRRLLMGDRLRRSLSLSGAGNETEKDDPEESVANAAQLRHRLGVPANRAVDSVEGFGESAGAGKLACRGDTLSAIASSIDFKTPPRGDNGKGEDEEVQFGTGRSALQDNSRRRRNRRERARGNAVGRAIQRQIQQDGAESDSGSESNGDGVVVEDNDAAHDPDYDELYFGGLLELQEKALTISIRTANAFKREPHQEALVEIARISAYGRGSVFLYALMAPFLSCFVIAVVGFPTIRAPIFLAFVQLIALTMLAMLVVSELGDSVRTSVRVFFQPDSAAGFTSLGAPLRPLTVLASSIRLLSQASPRMRPHSDLTLALTTLTSLAVASWGVHPPGLGPHQSRAGLPPGAPHQSQFRPRDILAPRQAPLGAAPLCLSAPRAARASLPRLRVRPRGRDRSRWHVCGTSQGG